MPCTSFQTYCPHAGFFALLSCVLLAWPAAAADEEPGDDAVPYVRLNAAVHTAPINALAFNRESNRLYTGGVDKDVHVWQLNKSWEHAPDGIWRWEISSGNTGAIYGLAVSPLNGYVAIGGYGNRGFRGDVVWLRPSDGNYFASYFPENQKAEHGANLVSLAFSPNGKWFASVDLKGRALLWPGEQANQASAKKAGPLKLQKPVLEANAPDVQRTKTKSDIQYRPLAFVGNDWFVFPSVDSSNKRPYDVFRLQRLPLKSNALRLSQLETLGGEYYTYVTALAGSLDGRYLAAAEYLPGEHQLSVYDFREKSPKPTGLFRYTNDNDVVSLAFSSNGKYLAVGRKQERNKGVVELWDVAAKERKWTSNDTHWGMPFCAVSPNDRWLAFVSRGGNEVTIGEINMDSGDVANFIVKPGGDQIERVAFAPQAATPDKADDYRILFDTAAKKRWIFDPSKDGDERCHERHDDEPFVDSEPVKPTKIGQAREGLIVTLQPNVGKSVQLKLPSDVQLDANRYCWIPDPSKPKDRPSRLAVSVCPANRILIFDVPASGGSCPLVRIFQSHSARVTSLSVSSDQRYLASGSLDGTVDVWVLKELRNASDLVRAWGVVLEKRPDGNNVVKELDSQGPLFNRGLRVGDVIERLEWKDSKGVKLSANKLETIRSQMLVLSQKDASINLFASRESKPQKYSAYPVWSPLLSLYTYGRDWIAWSPMGYYDASSRQEAEKLIGWQFTRTKGTRPSFSTAESHYRTYLQPDLIGGLLGTADLDVSLEIAKLYDPEPPKPNVPTVRLLQPGGDMSPSDHNLVIEAEIDPNGHRNLQVHLLRLVKNQMLGMEFPISDGIEEVTSDGSKTIVWKRIIDLDQVPARKFQLKVVAGDALAESAPFAVKWNSPAIEQQKIEELKRRRVIYVLTVGVSQYEDSVKTGELNDFWKFKTDPQPAKLDAERVARVIFDGKPDAFDGVVQKVLTGREATSAENIRKELGKVMARANEDDLVVFYFTGHSVAQPIGKSMEFYLAPSDGDQTLNVSEFLVPSFCGYTRKKDDRGVGCPSKVLVLDSCQSGTALNALKTLGHDNNKLGLNTWMFAACQQDQEAYQLRSGGKFTAAIVSALSAFPVDSQDIIYTSDLNWYLNKKEYYDGEPEIWPSSGQPQMMVKNLRKQHRTGRIAVPLKSVH